MLFVHSLFLSIGTEAVNFREFFRMRGNPETAVYNGVYGFPAGTWKGCCRL